MLVLRWNQRGKFKGPFPKGTVPFGKGLVSTLPEVNVMKMLPSEGSVDLA